MRLFTVPKDEIVSYNRVPKCDVTKILILEYLNFGSGF